MTDLIAALDRITGPAKPTAPTRCKHKRHPDQCGHCDALIHRAEEQRLYTPVDNTHADAQAAHDYYNRGDQ